MTIGRERVVAGMIELASTLTVGDDISTGRPEALQEAKNLRGNGSAGCAGSSQGGCERCTLDERTVLGSRREERAATVVSVMSNFRDQARRR